MGNPNKQYLNEEKELRISKLKTEGIVYHLDKEQAEDQVIVEVGTAVEKPKVEKDDKQTFEDFKEVYKGVIDMKCQQDFGSSDDKKLWEDTAKEMFLKSKYYVPEVGEKPTGELEQKVESRGLSSK